MHADCSKLVFSITATRKRGFDLFCPRQVIVWNPETRGRVEMLRSSNEWPLVSAEELTDMRLGYRDDLVVRREKVSPDKRLY